MSLKAYNAVFHEPPININNSIGISTSEHPALISLFKPNNEIITSIYVLVNNDVLSGTTTKSNNLKLSIISVDSSNSYLPSDHTAAQAEAAKDQNNFNDYVTKLHEESLSGVVSKTNINSINGQTWIEFKFTAGFITDPSNLLSPDSYYGILISDTSESNLINNVFYTDKTYNQDSLKRTLFLKIDDDELTWQNFQIGDNNVQLCVAYATSELNTTSELNYGSISTGGPNSKRNTGIGMFIRNTSDTATYTVDNFTPVPRSGDTDIGLENFTYNSNFKWTYFDPNELPSTSSEIQSASTVSSGINVELDPDDFVFLYQKDWIAPLPVQTFNKLSRQALHTDYTVTTDEDELFDLDQTEDLSYGAKRYKYDEIKLHSENYFYNYNNAVEDTTTIEKAISKAYSTNYPVISQINANLQTIKARQIIKNSDDEFQFNVFEILPWTTEFFTNSTTGQKIADDTFSANTFYLNSTVEREEWAVDNALISNPPNASTDFEKNSSGFLKSYGTEIDASSTSEKLIFSNTKIFPETTDSSIVTDVRNVGYVYIDRTGTDNPFRISRNNTINLENIPIIQHSENSLKYKLLFNANHAEDNFPYPPHLVLRNYSAGSNNSQNIVLGGVSLYTSSYSDYHGDLDLKASDITTTGNISPSRTSIIDSALGQNELPLEKTSFSDATNIYGKGLTLTIHQTDELSPNATSRAFVDTKYLIRHISDNIVTVEGKVMAYGLCTTSRNAADWSVTTKLINIAESDFDEWSNVTSGNYYLVVNPFGLLFDDLDNGLTVKKIYNNGDPIELLPINTFSTTAGEAIITTNSISASFWRKIFPTWINTDDLEDDDDVAYTYPHPLKRIPFYIIEIPSVTASGANEATSITGSPYGTFDPKWIGQFPDFFEIEGQIYAAGPYIANSANLPSSSYISGLGSQTEDALLPLPSEETAIGYSITFPYLEDVNDLSSLEWLGQLMSGLGSDMTNLDLNEDSEIVIYDNPCDKYRSRFENDGSTYHQFNIAEALVSTDSPENIMKNIHYTSFDSIGDSVQIHISEKQSNTINNFKYLSFIYGVDTDNASNVSSSCELEIKAHSNNFIIAKDAPVIDLVSSITLSSTGSDAQIGDTLESIYSYEFENPLEFNDFLIRRTGGDSSAHINNFVLFNDMCVYGRCLNPMYIFRDNGTSFCEINPDGYIVVDLGYSQYVHEIKFIISKSSSSQSNFDENAITFDISVSDPNITSEFTSINKIQNNSSSVITTNINRTCKYILIKPKNSNITLYAQKLVVDVSSMDYVYYYGASYTENIYLPSTVVADAGVAGDIANPVTQPRNYKYANFPYESEGKFATLSPRTSSAGYSNLYIPIGTPDTSNTAKPNLFVSSSPNALIEDPTSITQLAFNIKQSNNSQIASNDSYLFKLHSSQGTIPTGASADIRYSPADDGTTVNDFTERTTILAAPYSREPEEGYYTISSLGENKIYLNTSDIIFANNNLKGWVARLDIFKDLYAIIKKSGISSNGESWIEIQGSTAGLGLISGGRMYIEKSNVVSFPAFNATWLRLEYLNTTIPVDIFGLKIFTPILSNSNVPVDIVSNSNFSVLGWDIKINYVQD